MTLSDISIKNPVFAWMLMIGLIVFGWIGFERLGVSQLPDVDFPVVSVSVAWEGAAPEVMETEVTDIIEDAVMSVEGIREVTSSSMQGQSQISIEFNLKRDIDVALQEVQTKIAQAQRNLPRDIDPPVVTKTNPEDQPIMFIALSGDVPFRDLNRYVSETLRDQITTVDGVGSVRLGGYVDPNLRVWLDAKKMQDFQLTVEDVLNSIQNQHADLSAGYISAGAQEVNVRVYGEAQTPEQFEKIIISQRVRGGPIWKPIRIGEIGTVEVGLADIRRISRASGKRAMGIGVIKQRGTNAVSVAKAVKKRIQQIRPNLPPKMELNVVFDTTRFIQDSVNELKFVLLLSVILTSLVCYLFLGSWSATINVLLAIPTSIMGSFIVIYFSGFTLNIFTMLGLSLVVGIVVDDAIMVLENISRHQEMGHNRMQSAIFGTREITFAALAASLSILAIFIPVIFMEGIIGKFFFQFGVTISVAVAFSLLEALTITPMRCSRFLEVGHTTRLGLAVDAFMKRLTEAYRTALHFCLNYRGRVLLIALGLFILSCFTAVFLKKEFVPSQDQSRFLARISLPLGSSLETTDVAFKEAEAFLLSSPEVERIMGIIGGFGGSAVHQGMIFITMKDPKDRPRVHGRHVTQQEFMRTVRKKLSSIPKVERAVIQDLSQSGFSAKRGFPIEFTLVGPEWDELARLSGLLMDRMKASEMMTDIDTDFQPGMPELQIHPDRDKAAARGVSILSIADTINAMIGGVRSGKFTSHGKRYDVRVRLAEADRSNVKDVQNIWVRNQHGELVPLSEVTTNEVKPALFSITRTNRERAIRIFANPATGVSQDEALQRMKKIAKETLPTGYRIVFSGGAQSMKESFRGLIFAIILGIFVAYMILGTQFNSFIHPLTVLLALPFSISGAFWALWLRGNTLNLYSMIGLILLMGIVKKNSILLVDFTNERRRQGKAPREALLEACPIRLRPILMTTLSTVAAAIPEALAFGPGAEAMIPMATAIVGGVIVSTVLTLFVVPCAYYELARFEKLSYVSVE